MRALLVLLVIAGCNRGRSGPEATGKLVFDVRPEAAVFLATEAAVMRSESILHRVREQFRTTVDAAAIRVRREPNTMILAVTVRDRDPRVAVDTCNQLLQTYIEYRMGMALTGFQQQIQVLHENLEKSPDDAELQKRITELELERQLRRIDVRLLDPCTAR